MWKFCGKEPFWIYNSPEALQKRCLSTNFPHQEITSNFGILRSASRLVLIKGLAFTGKALIKEKSERHVEKRKLCEVEPKLITRLTKLSQAVPLRCSYKKVF